MEEIKRFFSKNNKEDFLNYMNLKNKIAEKNSSNFSQIKTIKMKIENL